MPHVLRISKSPEIYAESLADFTKITYLCRQFRTIQKAVRTRQAVTTTLRKSKTLFRVHEIVLKIELYERQFYQSTRRLAPLF